MSTLDNVGEEVSPPRPEDAEKKVDQAESHNRAAGQRLSTRRPGTEIAPAHTAVGRRLGGQRVFQEIRSRG